MGRVGGVGFNPLDGLGQLLYGGPGSITSAVNVALLSIAGTAARYRSAAGVAYGWNQAEPNGNIYDANLLIDASLATQGIGNDPGAGSAWEVDLVAPKRIGYFRIYNSDTPSRKATGIKVQSSTDGTTWTDRDTSSLVAVFDDSGLIALPAPITARYWRALIVATVSAASALRTLEFHAVETVGAGNAVVLAPAAERRIMGFNPDAGVPEWQARGAALADLAAAPGIDVAAVAGTQVVTKAEHDLTIAKVNTLVARLEAAGLLAS